MSGSVTTTVTARFELAGDSVGGVLAVLLAAYLSMNTKQTQRIQNGRTQT